MAQINEWIEISNTSGEGDATITLTASTYTELTDRVANLKVSTRTKTAYVNIKQTAFEPSLSLSYNTLIFNQTELQDTTTVTSNVAWTAEPSADWITLSQTSGDSGSTTIIIEVDTIGQNESRTGYVTFYYGDSVKTLVVSQVYEIVFIVNPTSVDLTSGAKTITITSDMDWTATTTDDWYTLSTTSGVSGTSTITVTPSTTNVSEDIVGSIDFYIGNLKKESVVVKQLIVAEDQFYIEAIDELTIDGVVYYDSDIEDYRQVSFTYLIEGQEREWKDTKSITLNPNEKIYIKNFRVYRTRTSRIININGRFNTGGNLMKCRDVNGGKYFFMETDVVDASNLILIGDEFGSIFYSCKKLKYAPKYIWAEKGRYGFIENAFKNCDMLETAPFIYMNGWTSTLADDLSNTNRWGGNAFKGCTNLKYLRIYINSEESNAYYFFNTLPAGCVLISNFNPSYFYADRPYGKLYVDNNLYSVTPSSFIDLTDNEEVIIPLLDSDIRINIIGEWVNVEKTNDTLIISNKDTEILDREATINIYNNSNELTNSILVSQVVEPIENCFYISPLPNGEMCEVRGRYFIYNNSIGTESIEYYLNNEWQTLTFFDLDLKINKRLYMRNYNRSSLTDRSNFGWLYLGYCNVGGDIITLLGTMKNYYATHLFAQDSMYFSNHSAIVNASKLVLPATNLADSCYASMFKGCNSLRTAPELPAITLAPYCYDYMFRSCSSLITQPELPATTLTPYCYCSMFKDCSNINYIKMLATDISAEGCLFEWVEGVSSTGTFVKNSNMNDLPTGSSGIPSGWEVQNV